MKTKTKVKAGGCYDSTKSWGQCKTCCDKTAVGYAHDNCMESCELIHGQGKKK